MLTDHPHVRDSHTCVFCLKGKDRGLVACWPCYREHGLKHGNPAAEKQLDQFECKLVGKAWNSFPRTGHAAQMWGR